MKRVSIISTVNILLLVIVLFISSCTGRVNDIPINYLVWFMPEWIPNKTTNVISYCYSMEIDANSLVLPNEVYLNFPNVISFKTIVRRMERIIAVPSPFNLSENHDQTTRYQEPYTRYDNGYLSVYIYIKPTLEEEVELINISIPEYTGSKSIQTNTHIIQFELPENRFSIGSARLTVVFREGYDSPPYVIQTNVFISKGTYYYVATIPISGQSSFPDTVVYLYRKIDENYIRIAVDDNSGYAGNMSRIYRDLAPGEYLIKVVSKTPSSNSFGIYYGTSNIVSNLDTTVHSFTNYLPEDALRIYQDIPTNTFISNRIERFFKFVISN